MYEHAGDTQSAHMPGASDTVIHAYASEMSFLPVVAGVFSKTLMLRQSHSAAQFLHRLTSTVPSLGQALVTFPEGGNRLPSASQFGRCLPSNAQKPLCNQEVRSNLNGSVADCDITSHCHTTEPKCLQSKHEEGMKRRDQTGGPQVTCDSARLAAEVLASSCGFWKFLGNIR